MHFKSPPTLTFDEIDDLLYFTRTHETSDLQQGIIELSQKYECSAREILEACVDPENGNTILHFCSANGYDDTLTQFLLELKHGVGSGQVVSQLINHNNKEGNTPLHWAAYNGHLDIVKALVTEGADMWIKNTAGHLAMFEAERAEKNEVVQFLLEAGGREVERAGTEGAIAAEDEEVSVGGSDSNVPATEHDNMDTTGENSNG